MAYEALEPMGNVEPTYMAASICAIVINSISAIFSSKKTGKAKTVSPLEFIPDWHGDMISEEETTSPKREQTLDEQKKSILSIAKTFGAKTKKRGTKK